MRSTKKAAILQQYPKNTINNTTINNLDGSQEAIEVFPPEIFFKDIEPNQNYEVTVTVRNVTKKMRRIKFTQPQSQQFNIDFENNGSVAAGLSTKMNVQFETNEDGEFHDFIEIHTEGNAQPYRLHLHAYRPAADIQFEPIVNLRYIPVGQERYELLDFKNEGRMTGHVRLVEEPKTKSGVIIEPSQFSIDPEEVVRVKVGLLADAPEVINKTIKAYIDNDDGASARTIELTATCVEQNLSIVFEEGGGQKSSLNFGTIYMGEKREYPAFLINNGPQPASFKFGFLQGLRNLEENHYGEEDEDSFVSPAEVGKELTDRVLTAEPLAGVVGPYQQIPIRFICRTKKHDKRGGFSDVVDNGSHQHPMTGASGNRSAASSQASLNNFGEAQRFNVEPKDYASLAIVKFGMQEGSIGHADLKVQMMARTVYPDIKINKQSFQFGECATNERRDMTLTIKNKSVDLPLDFCFSKISNFRAMPAKGRLLPSAEHNINISFEPKNMGQFMQHIQLEILKGIYRIPIDVSGSANTLGKRVVGTRGPAGKPMDFAPQHTFTSQEAANMSTMQHQLSRKTSKGDAALAKMSDEQIQSNEEQVRTYLAMKANRERANNFVKHERINRVKDARVHQKIKETSRAPPTTLEEIARDPDIGMEYATPDIKFSIDHEVDPLYVEKPVGKYEPTATHLDKLRNKRVMDDTKTIKKKFKPEPTTQNELRDCQVELSGEQLQKIHAGPQKINFKNVFVKSSSIKSFNIQNDLRQHVYVRLMVDQYPELAQSTPLSQVIPAGQQAGFDIIFCSQKLKNFSAPITYYVNDRPFQFLVTAQSDPVSLELSRKTLKFDFKDDNMDMSVVRELTITNYGNAAAKFKWQHPSNIFIPCPLEDVIQAGSSCKVQVKFNPPGPRCDDEVLLLKIQDGATEELKCVGTVIESRCAFLEKQLNFGNVHVGLKAKDQTIHIRNQMRSPAIFHVINNDPELTIFPEKGKIQGDSKFAFTVGFISHVPTNFQSEIVVSIRGGKMLRIPVMAKAIVPEIEIDEKHIDFGGVVFGDQAVQPVTIYNNSDITAKLILDIRDYPEFEIILPDPGADDDVHSEVMVPIQEQPKYDDIINMNPDEVNDPLNEDQMSDDDISEIDEDAKRHVQLSIRATGRPFELKLKYTPKEVEDPQNFILPLSLVGVGEVKGLTRRIKAVGVKPRFFLEPTQVNFKTKVIAKGQKPLPFYQDIQISNPDHNPIAWAVNRDLIDESKVYQMNPMEGVLEANSLSTIRVTFNPHEPTEYVANIPLYLGDDKEKPYLIIELRGEGADAKIFFDRREIILPPVPLNIETKATFMVCHNGYESQNLVFKIANEVGKLPIDLYFPDGKNLGVAKAKVKCEATFKFSTPLSFTTFIDFFDDEGNKFSIPISGTTDNSIFSVYSFLQRNFDEICYRVEPNKPITLDQSVVSDMESAKTGFGMPGGRAVSKGASSVISRTARSLVGYNPVRPDILDRNAEFITRWFNATLNANSMQQFPADVISQNGAQVFELVQYLSGKKPPGQATTKQLSQANAGNIKDAIKVLISQYEELINFLKVNGAHLNTVRPEYLISISDYNKFLKINQKDGNASQRVVDKMFPYLSIEAWVTVFYQVMRIYYLNRITPKNFKALPGVPANDSNVEPHMTKSNIYSVSETILLKWMAYHYNQQQPMHPKTLTNFDADLQDGTVFAALIRNHYGEPQAFKDFRTVVNDSNQVAHNSRRIVQAVEEIGISTHIKPNDISEPQARDLLLFCVQLYQALPHYIPKASIEFPAVLGDLVTKNIELSNPSKSPISYWVKLIGSDDFSVDCEENHIKIEPGQSLAFPVKFQSRISSPVKGKIIFTNRKEGNVQAAAMVFELVSNVYERNSVEIIQKSTKLYKALQIDLSVENGFPQDVLFNVQVQYERNQPKKAAARGGRNAPVSKTNSKTNTNAPSTAAAKDKAIPEPYFCKVEQIKIRKGAQITVPILFLPFELGIHKCHIIFTDENVGEVQYTIVGKAELPDILDTFTGDCNSEEPFCFRKLLSYRNEKLEQAKNQIAEKEKKDSKAKRDANVSGAQDEKRKGANSSLSLTDQKFFEIEISNPFFTGPANILLHDMTAPKQVQNAAPGKHPGSKTDVSKQNNSVMALNESANQLELNCNPSKPASYTCYVILKSIDRSDIRLYEYKLTAIPQKIKAQLEFRVPARGQVTQDIPIVNNSTQEWKVMAILEQAKGGNFSLNRNQMLVKKGLTENFSLTFKPTWVCQTSGTLTLKNESTKEEYEYELKGIGEEPLAEDHRVLNCAARETQNTMFELKNLTDKPLTYTVWTDLQNAVGQKEFTIKPKQTFDYKLAITPLLGGVYTASITFQDNEERFIWYTVEVRTDSPKPEATIDLRAFIRKATSAEISLSNPLNEPITFEVFYQGEGLIGDQTFALEPKNVGTFNLIFSPLQAGDFVGNIGFLNEKVGEFWYDLNLIAEENPVVNLELLECELGRMQKHEVELENPTGKEMLIDYRNSNPTNFEVCPDKIVLPPYETTKVVIQYSPTQLDVVETGNVLFENSLIGKWEYNVEGKGLVPTTMEPSPVSTAVGSSTSSMLSFKNPFKEQHSVEVQLQTNDSQIFCLLLKRNKFTIGPLGILQIPYSFSPETMTESSATIIVSMSKELVWKFPLKGIAESASQAIDFHFRTRARRPYEETLRINLPGFNFVDADDVFRYELNVPSSTQKGLIDRSVFIDQRTTTLTHSDQPLKFDLRFEPLRPFKSQVEFIVYKQSGGRWKFNVIFESLEPEVDDVIIIQSPLHKTSSVSFKLTNHMKTYAEFQAHFTADSAVEFACHPKQGLLEPYGKEGTNFIVSFTPTEYGKQKIGRLVIQTEEMQWTYEIRGSHPQYKIPHASGGRIENKLSQDLLQVMNANKSKKNFMRSNLMATKYGSPSKTVGEQSQSKFGNSPKARSIAGGASRSVLNTSPKRQ